MFNSLKIKFKTLRYKTKIFWQGISKTIFLQIVFWGFFFTLEKIIGTQPINLSPKFIFWSVSILLVSFFIVSFLAFRELSPKHILKEKLKNRGVYSFLRHPFYGAIVFFLNPAIAIFFKSWGMIMACIVSYFLWKEFAKEEEKRLIEKFGSEYSNYQIKTSRIFIPRIFETAYLRKRILFYILVGFSSFFIVVVGFNLYTEFEARRASFVEEVFSGEMSILEDIETPKSTFKPKPTPKTTPKKSYKKKIDANAYENGRIKISKIGVKAPLVFVKNIKYLDYYHRYGVVHYPKTKTPGQGGAILLSGHSSGPPNVRGKYDYVFSKLNSLKSGDEIIIFYEGHYYYYKVFRKEIIWPSNVKLREYKGKETLTLISCWPVGTNSRRIVVEAQRIK